VQVSAASLTLTASDVDEDGGMIPDDITLPLDVSRGSKLGAGGSWSSMPCWPFLQGCDRCHRKGTARVAPATRTSKQAGHAPCVLSRCLDAVHSYTALCLKPRFREMFCMADCWHQHAVVHRLLPPLLPAGTHGWE
jgi:hypothetical protein